MQDINPEVSVEVSKAIGDLRTGDKVTLNGKVKIKVVARLGQAGIMVRDGVGNPMKIVYSGSNLDRWYYGLAGHEDVEILSVSKS